MRLPLRVVAVILAVSGAVGVLHYQASYALMRQSLQAVRELDAEGVRALLKQDIANELLQVQTTVALMARLPELIQAVTPDASPADVRRVRIQRAIETLHPLLGRRLFVEVFDKDEALLYSTSTRGAPAVARPWGVAEALAGDSVTATTREQGLSVRAFAPLAAPRGVEAALAVGFHIDTDFLHDLYRESDINLALADVTSGALIAANTQVAFTVEPGWGATALLQKHIVHHDYSDGWVTATYFAMTIADQTYLWIARQDNGRLLVSLGSTRKKELAMSLLLTVASALILGGLAYRHTRRLDAVRHEADAVIAREFGDAAPRPQGSELEQLANSVRVMQQRLVTRAQQLTESNRAVKAAEGAQREFFAFASHELRTPLNAILAFAHYVQQEPDADVRERDLGKIRESAELMLSLVNDTLDYARIEAGRFETLRQTYDLDDILQSVVNIAAPLAQAKGVRFVLDVAPAVPRTVWTDPLRLRQILTNLCANAIKFTARGEIVLAVSRAARDAADSTGTLQITVRDTGIGMREAEQERLFLPFGQGISSSEAHANGSGLGLALTKRLVEAMDGTIALRSTAGVGTSVTVTLPDAVRARAADQALQHDAAREWVAVIVADVTQREALCNMLGSLGYAAVVGADTATVSSHGSGTIAAFLVDSQMPGAARIVREAAAFDPQPKLVFIRDGLGVASVPGETGAVITNPVTRIALRAVLQNAVQTNQEKEDTRGTHAALLAGARVLIAEDNVINREIAVRALRGAGAAVVEASDGSKAVDAAASAPFDAVVMDVLMPVMDGIEATRAIRRLAATTGNTSLAGLPIIGLSASTVAGSQDYCIAAGMTAYANKPIAPHDLVELVARHTKRVAITPKASPPDLPESSGDIADLPRDLSHVQVAGFDVKRGLVLTGGKSHYLRVLEMFSNSSVQAVSRARALLEEGDTTAASRQIHGIVGNAGLLGAGRILQAALAAEQAFSHGAADSGTRLAELETLVKQANERLARDPVTGDVARVHFGVSG